MDKNPGDNLDFHFIVKPVNHGLTFQSVNYPDYFIAITSSGIFISKDTPIEDRSWNIIPSNKANSFMMVSLSNNPLWKENILTYTPDSSKTFLSENKGTIYQSIYLYTLPNYTVV